MRRFIPPQVPRHFSTSSKRSKRPVISTMTSGWKGGQAWHYETRNVLNHHLSFKLYHSLSSKRPHLFFSFLVPPLFFPMFFLGGGGFREPFFPTTQESHRRLSKHQVAGWEGSRRVPKVWTISTAGRKPRKFSSSVETPVKEKLGNLGNFQENRWCLRNVVFQTSVCGGFQTPKLFAACFFCWKQKGTAKENNNKNGGGFQ